MFGVNVLLLLLMVSTGYHGTSSQEASDSIRVLVFNGDGAQRETTWAEYGETTRILGDYTLCLRFNIWVFRLLTAVIYLLSTKDYDDDPISFEVYFEKIRTKYGGYGRFYPLPSNLATNKWYHYCQVRDVTAGEGRVYLDGSLIIKEPAQFAINGDTRNVVLGQDEFKVKYSLSGRLSQINMWSRVLSEEEIMRVAKCEVNLEGDLLTWSKEWKAYGIEEEYVPLEDLCTSVSRGKVTVPLPLLRFPDAVYLCRGLGGAIPTPSSFQDIAKEMSLFKGVEECDRQWAGITDEEKEDVWLNPFTGEMLNTSEIVFREINPDGDKYQNCIRIHAKGLEDTDCQKHSCGACHTLAGTTWTLRGICEEEKRMYYLDLVPSPLSFRGYGEYAVRQDDDGVWVWSNIITNTTMATLNQDDIDLNYPIGRLPWNLTTEVCHQESGTRILTLSSCTADQFTCSDGSCVDFLKRCDLKFDCEDKTDESNCNIINFPQDYRSKLPPRPASDSPLPIALDVTMDTLNIDTTTMLLSVSYNLRMTWNDNRLTYNNLKNLTRLNTVSQEQVDILWRPQIGFINTDDIQNTAVDSDSVTTILKRDQSFQPDLSNPYEVEIYRGDTNPVSTIRKYSTVYTCNFDLILYPFDIQNCYMQLKILSASSEYLIYDYLGSSVEYLGPNLLVEYGIGKIDLHVRNSTQSAESRVRIELIRRYGYAMLNIYIPSLTLLTISYVTLFFRPSIFEVRVMTALTSLLVLATLFTQVSASLPKTSYFKMVDIWLLFCILLIFFIILFHTIIDRYVDYSVFLDSNPHIKEGTWLKPRSSSGKNKVTSIRVHPVGDLAKDDDLRGKSILSGLKDINVDLDFCVKSSKVSIFFIFLLFNAVYWGTLARESGLVYYLYN